MPGQGDVLKSGNVYTSSPTTTIERFKNVTLQEICIKGQHAELEKRLLDDVEINETFEDGTTPLTVSACYGHTRGVKLLLRYGAQPNLPTKSGDQAIHFAIKRSYPKIVAYLLDYGADVNCRGSNGLCPIHIAAKCGNEALLRVLLERGARTDRYTDTRNPQHALHLAASRGHVKCIKVLLEFNNYTEPRDSYGRTPLFTAVVKGRRDVVWLLATSNANVNSPDSTGKIPLQAAIEADNEDICHTLCENGADVSLRYVVPRKEDDIAGAIDRYGMIKSNSKSDLVGDITKLGAEAQALQIELASVKKWERMIKHWQKYTRFNKEKLRQRIARGIPDCLRGQVWKLLSKLKYHIDSTEYKELRSKDSPSKTQIDLDVCRAFRNHDLFRTRYGKGQCALFNLLKAYSNFDSTLGYCQGMAEMAALLLKYFPEREAFSMFDILMKEEKWEMRGYFLTGFPKLQQTLFVHDKLFEDLHPALFEHFKNLDVIPALYATKWYLTAFLDIFSYEVTLRLWDLLFLDGYEILYSIAIGVLGMFQDELITMKFDKLMMFMHTLSERNIDVNNLIYYVTQHRIPSRTVRKYTRMYDDVVIRKKKQTTITATTTTTTILQHTSSARSSSSAKSNSSAKSK